MPQCCRRFHVLPQCSSLSEREGKHLRIPAEYGLQFMQQLRPLAMEPDLNLIRWIHRCLMPAWTGDSTPDTEHPYRRRFTPAYRRKRRMVKNIWIGSGLVMIASGSTAATLGLMLATTFLSFMILDETG